MNFSYHAREASGTAVSGVVEARDRREALNRLAEKGLYPTRLVEKAVNGSPGDETHTTVEVRRSDALRGRVSRKEITALTRELATLLEATIPIPRALEGLAEQEENPALRHLLHGLGRAVRQGSSFSSALQQYPRLFTPLYTSMVEVGEEMGRLDQVMVDLADLLEREDEIRSEVVGAVAYPSFVLVMGVVTTFVLLAFVMPRIFGMLEETVAVLPLPTRILLETSGFLERYWILLLGAVVGLAVGARLYSRTPRGALLWDTCKLRLPVLGPVFRASALGRFARTLGSLAHAGVSLLPALRIVQNTVGNSRMALSIAEAAEETRGGASLAEPLRRLGLFPPTMVQMVAVGEETGRLDGMLLRVASIQERHMRRRSRALISLLAPALILVVGALVGFIVIALLLPIFQMSQSLS